MNTKNNIDQIEVEKFSQYSNEWWNVEGVFKTLHDINPARLSFIESKISFKHTDILDVGCGGGILSEAMATAGGNVTAIDASQDNVSSASLHARDNGLSIYYESCHAEEFAEKYPERFDLITCMELLEHVPDPTSLIKACSVLVKPGGHVVFSTLNRNIKSYLYAVLAGEYLLKLLPVGTHDYKNFIRPSELVSWCNRYGLKTKEIKGLDYNPLISRCSLTDKPDVNYIIHTIKE